MAESRLICEQGYQTKCVNCPIRDRNAEPCEHAIEVAPVRHGRWLEKKTWSLGRWVSWFECSECGDRDYNAEMYEAMPFCNVSNYCPNYGARMDGAE